MKLKPSLSLSPFGPDQPLKLRELMARATRHHDTELTVLQAVPEPLNRNLRFVSYHEGQLVLQVNNPTQASQLRFRQQEIMESLRKEEMFQYVWKVQIKVQPARYHHRPEPRPMTLSNENARLLKEEAGHTKDKALREVLEKLASHASGGSD